MISGPLPEDLPIATPGSKIGRLGKIGDKRSSQSAGCRKTDGAIKKIYCAQTLPNSIRAVCAVERYHPANRHLPTPLQELAPSFLASSAMDSMTGYPLHDQPPPDDSFVICGTGRVKEE